MSIRNKSYRIKGKSPYFKKKYGTSNPIIKIEGKDTDLWVKGWQNTPVAACVLYAQRVFAENLPLEGTVYYGHIQHGEFGLGELAHETELGEEIAEEPAELRPVPELKPAGARR